MRMIACNRNGNILHVLWEDGREQTLEIVGFWDLFSQGWSRVFRHVLSPKPSDDLLDQTKL